MMITLTRDTRQPAPNDCTLGILSANGRSFQTMERAWVPIDGYPCGTPMKSCVPVGVYKLEPRFTEARGNHWQLINPALGIYRTPTSCPASGVSRSLILIHAANWAHELLGCIAPGKQRSRLSGEWMVQDSRAAMNELRMIIGGSLDLQLEIA